jgi:hypothetical protein
MTGDQRDWVIVLATVSAICEFWGTGTVWLSYRRSARVGDNIRNEIVTAKAQIGPDERGKPLPELVNLAARFRDPFELQQVQLANLDQLETLAAPLATSWWIASGLVAFLLGAVLGLVAVIIGVS